MYKLRITVAVKMPGRTSHVVFGCITVVMSEGETIIAFM